MFQIIEYLGGKDVVTQKLSKPSGQSYTPKALDKCYDRKSLPGHVMRQLMQLADEAGIDYTADDFNFHEASVSGNHSAHHSNVAGVSE